MAAKLYTVQARRPRAENEPENPRHWMNVGVATEQDDGNILICLNAIPFNFDGALKLKVADKKHGDK